MSNESYPAAGTVTYSTANKSSPMISLDLTRTTGLGMQTHKADFCSLLCGNDPTLLQ